ncbi:hypothetical protein EmuJ_000278800 [Echinococcus multilocularis]|uniref:Uncharacterized protein n=1 Tax=Echinococcus multilocularis TaxID=6211 RepID=A0A068XX71_ECHMU|nr:hypothetical protein EmuJ_000278800 [Echinococcus multilocularis]
MQGTSVSLGTPHSVVLPSQLRRPEGVAPGSNSLHRSSWRNSGRLSRPGQPTSLQLHNPGLLHNRRPAGPSHMPTASQTQPLRDGRHPWTRRSSTAGHNRLSSSPPSQDARPSTI